MTAQDPSPSGRPSWRGLVAVAAVVAAVLGASGIARERTGRLPVEVCIAPDGKPKVIAIAQTAEEGGLRVELEYLEFGVPVDVAPPPAESVAAP